MPNHTHSLLRRFEDKHIEDIVDAHKGYTAHKANEYLNRSGQFWMEDYFDRFIRNEEHYWNTVRYIENRLVSVRSPAIGRLVAPGFASMDGRISRWFCPTGAAGDGRAPTEEHTCVNGWGF